ncbi:MoxR family ATPase [Acidobacteria bacterium AH-259-D05]|nr:MoxR family ATPase [Acidobacteria bacterium AH-259-D05]
MEAVVPIPELESKIKALQASIQRVIKGKPEVVELVSVALLAQGHLLIEDVPGVGKTTLAHALARSFDCTFQRIQFTSDLLPSDLTGVSIFNQLEHNFEFRKGPLFANVVLADEINRTTPKTQSALLEAMSEGKVTVENQTHELPKPFVVMATQNPIEHHGTYPLPESQLDRFLMRIEMGYPSHEDEKEILRSNISYDTADHLMPVMSAEEVLEAQKLVDKVEMDDILLEYLMALVRATRESEYLTLGVSPRGAMALYRASQARAFARGRHYCTPDDLKQLAAPVFSHRVIVSSKYSSPLQKREESQAIIQELTEEVEVPL